MGCVAPRIDVTALKARHRSARSEQRPEVDTWFELAGRSGRESFDLVAAACGPVGPGVFPYQTVTGTMVEFYMPEWVERCQQVAQALEDAGESVAVTVPPTPPRPLSFDELSLPCLVLIHRLDPPAAQVPPAERHGGHWTLPDDVARHRLRTAVDWAIPAGEFGTVGYIGMIPATREDAAEKLGRLFEYIFTIQLNGFHSNGSLAREVDFSNWGVSVWRGSYRGKTQLERVQDLTRLLVEFGPEIDLGAIALSDTRGPGALHKHDRLSPWRASPELWAEYVPDAHAIQVLNDQQLARAHDLSAWQVETISPGKHLVAARDLEPWFSLQADQDHIDYTTMTWREIPPRQIRDQARHDFGQMILPAEQLTNFPR